VGEITFTYARDPEGNLNLIQGRRSMSDDAANLVRTLVAKYQPARPRLTVDALRAAWARHAPRAVSLIKAEQRGKQESLGTPVPVLKAMGKALGKAARGRVDDFLPLARALWAQGREGRVVAVHLLGPMELEAPATMMPVLLELAQGCHTWEDADQLAMNGVEPVVRKQPGAWLREMQRWQRHDNLWVRRIGVTVIGRLPMRHPGLAAQCLEAAEPLLHDEELDVKRAASFALRIAGGKDVPALLKLLERHVPPEDARATWILCDVIRSMTKRYLPGLKPLLPRYRRWSESPALSATERRSVESAVRTLESAK
jgi:3-methyladenine DNA glycosylase AlkD